MFGVDLVDLQDMLFGTITKISSIQLSRNGFVNFPIVDPNHLKKVNVSLALSPSSFCP